MKTTSACYIDASKETYSKLSKMFNVVEKTIYLALTYRTNNKQAHKIRYTAVKLYGAKPMAHCPQCETMHNLTEDGRQVLIQYFDNGIKFEIDKQTGNARAWDRHGIPILKESGVNFPRLSEIQILLENYS